jgi:hypothetical protein
LSLGGDGTDWEGYFVTDNPSTGCYEDSNACLFAGYWQLDLLSVPEPGTVELLASAIAMMLLGGAVGAKRRRALVPK